MPDDLKETIKKLTPGALRLFKRQLLSMPEKERSQAFKSLSGVPELADIVGTSVRDITQAPAPTAEKQDVPLWKRALSTFGAPFEWVNRNIAEPFGTIATSIATPAIAGTEGLGWLERERAEYKAWDDPNWGFLGVKGVVETLPWLAIPGIGSVAGKAGGIAAGLGRLGTAGKIAGTALEYSPWGIAEKAAGAATKATIKPAAKLLERRALSKLAGEISQVHNTTGGATFNPVLGNIFGKESYALSVFPERELQIQGKNITNKQVEDYIKKNADILSSNRNTSVGTWFDEQANKTYLDISLTLADKEAALAAAEKAGQKAIFDLKGGKSIYITPQRKVTLTHYSSQPNLGVIKPEFMGTAQSGSEARFLKEYGSYFKDGWFAKRSYHYLPKQPVEERFVNKPRYTIKTNLRIFDAKTATPEEMARFSEARATLLAKFKKEFGENFGGLEQQYREVDFAAAKELGYDAFRGEQAIAVFKELPVKAPVGPAMPEAAKQNLLQMAGEGRPGLEATAMGLVYRSPEGKPIAVATVIPEPTGALRVGSIVTDDKSLLKGRAVKAIMDELQKNPAGVIMPPRSEMSPQAAKLVDKLEAKVGGAEPSVPPKPTAVGVGGELPPKPPKPPIGTQAMPGGFTAPQESAITKLVNLVKTAKPLRKETAQLYKEEHARRIADYEDSLMKFTNEGFQPESAHQMALRDLAGKYPQASKAELESLRAGMTEVEVQELFGIVRDATYKSGYDRVNTFTALQTLLLNNISTDAEIKLLEETFGGLLAKELLKKRPFLTKLREFVIDLANAPRALLASGDISGLLRQGGVLSAAHPIEAMRTVRPMVQAMFSSQNELLMDRIIRSRPFFNLAERHGLYVAPLTTTVSVRLAEREEVMMSRLMSKIPFVRASNRAYVTGLNDLRTRIWEKTLTTWEKAGIKANEQDYKDLAQFINWATGRGTLPKTIAQQGSLLNAMFFSPRLIFSRLELPLSILPSVTKSALVRKEAMRTLLTSLGAGVSILAAVQLSGGGKIELDPRSAGFGKIKVGNTRLDIWTGYAQYLRFAAQLATSQRKTEGGFVQSMTRKDIVDRFVQTKLSPAVGLINDLLKGETYLGEELPPKSAKSVLGQAYQRMMPLSVQDLIDGFVQDGPLGAFSSSVGVLGIGVVTYSDDVKKARDKAAKDEYGMTWEELGLRQGRAAQLRLEQTNKLLLDAEKEQEKRFTTGSISNMKQWQNESQSIEDTYREASNLAAKEFRATQDGVLFKDKVDQAAATRRQMYAARAKRKEYQDIVDYYSKPLKPEQTTKMNPGDVARREYYKTMYGLDMYDQYGNYLFDEAERREQEFIKRFGQAALNYIEEYQGSRWLDKPTELIYLEQARETLKPYWQITDYVWSMYPSELKSLSDQITLMERTDPERARQALKRFPAILRARELIAQYKKMAREGSPAIMRAYKTFYG